MENEVIVNGVKYVPEKEEVEIHSLRIEGLSVKNTAKRGDVFYFWTFDKRRPSNSSNWDICADRVKFKTREECQTWGDKYAKAIEFFNK